MFVALTIVAEEEYVDGLHVDGLAARRHAHEGTRYAMSGAVARSKNDFFIFLDTPVKVTAYDIFWFVKYKVVYSPVRQEADRWKNSGLDPAGILNAVSN